MDAVRAIIADDDPLARRMLKEGLQRAGMVVIAVAWIFLTQPQPP